MIQATESEYKYDVFLSYRRSNAWPAFMRNIFVPMFRHWLDTELGRATRVFFDADMIETGESWPYSLALGVASSKIMVCLWSTEYFASPWCQAELGLMMARREITRQPSGPLPLILAMVIHDGDNFSPALDDIQRLSIKEYANPWLARDSPNAERLSEQIRKFSAHVSHALQRAPACDPSWPGLAVDSFIRLFERRAVQHDVPSLGG